MRRPRNLSHGFMSNGSAHCSKLREVVHFTCNFMMTFDFSLNYSATVCWETDITSLLTALHFGTLHLAFAQLAGSVPLLRVNVCKYVCSRWSNCMNKVF